MSLIHKILNPFHGLGFLLFPRLCEGCRKPLVTSEEVICIGCETHLSYTHYHHIPDNETALRLSGRIHFQHATSLAYFINKGLLQHLIHGLKYNGKTQNGIYLGKELGTAIKNNNWNIDAIIPVPLHKKKELSRGYNQSMVIGKGISEILEVPVLNNVLVRTRYTESQTDKTREERIQNVSDAFKVIKPQEILGRHILLIDDVLTTGATLEACATSLLSLQNVTISIATCGIAVD